MRAEERKCCVTTATRLDTSPKTAIKNLSVTTVLALDISPKIVPKLLKREEQEAITVEEVEATVAARWHAIPVIRWDIDPVIVQKREKMKHASTATNLDIFLENALTLITAPTTPLREVLRGVELIMM